MNQNVVDILIYLYENYIDGLQGTTSDQDEIQENLRQAGFPEKVIQRAFTWMDDLTLRQAAGQSIAQGSRSFRVFTEEEEARLDLQCRGYLMFLEQNAILDHASRELVIDRILALEHMQIDVAELKWVVLMVLINQPGQENAFAQMEELVYHMPANLH